MITKENLSTDLTTLRVQVEKVLHIEPKSLPNVTIFRLAVRMCAITNTNRYIEIKANKLMADVAEYARNNELSNEELIEGLIHSL